MHWRKPSAFSRIEPKLVSPQPARTSTLQGMAKQRRTKSDRPVPGRAAKRAPADVAPVGYAGLLAAVKQRVRTAQVRAASAVNRELVLLYWQIGRDILHRQREEGWGAKVIDRLAADLHAAFPDMKGFSTRNLKYMRSLADAFPDEAFVQEALAQITWYHAITLLDKVADPNTRKGEVDAASAFRHYPRVDRCEGLCFVHRPIPQGTPLALPQEGGQGRRRAFASLS
jgi:predicted nuclease of restriction endonuclease-like (RecB) superfamily